MLFVFDVLVNGDFLTIAKKLLEDDKLASGFEHARIEGKRQRDGSVGMLRDKIRLRCYGPAVFIDEGSSVCLVHDRSDKRVVAARSQAFIAHGVNDGRVDIAYDGLGSVFRRCRCRNARFGDRDRLLGICKIFMCGDFDAVAVKLLEDDEFRPLIHDGLCRA